jgi:mRNA interferase MazF
MTSAFRDCWNWPGRSSLDVTPAAGGIALVPFAFSDLSQSKLRPAVVLADVGQGDCILCQVTSNPYGDSNAVPIDNSDLDSGTLRVSSFDASR